MTFLRPIHFSCYVLFEGLQCLPFRQKAVFDHRQSLQEKERKMNFEFLYSVFHRFRQAKFDYGGSILSSSQFLLLHQLPQKVKLTLKVVKVDSKIIVLLPEI